jgi:hypothetical protein
MVGSRSIPNKNIRLRHNRSAVLRVYAYTEYMQTTPLYEVVRGEPRVNTPLSFCVARCYFVRSPLLDYQNVET